LPKGDDRQCKNQGITHYPVITAILSFLSA
jgi:hypothetical protein